MIKHKNKTIKIPDVITCDMCNQVCEDQEHMSLQANWGYHSNFDSEQWSAQVCDECSTKLKNLIKFNIKEY